LRTDKMGQSVCELLKKSTFVKMVKNEKCKLFSPYLCLNTEQKDFDKIS
jgi:hypothetical protein